jgi:hypothetical protein
MASFGRTKLMAVAIKRFFTQLKRHALDAFHALPEARARCRQQAAEDLHFVITRFAENAEFANRSTYKAMVTIFDQQCELSGDTVVVKTKVGGDCIQNPSDLEATYSGHKGSGYQVQITETCVPDNEV